MGPKTKSRYSLHPGFAREAAFRANLEERTGRSLEQWVEFTRKRGPRDAPKPAAARVEWLKSEHGLGTDYAKWVAAECEAPTGAAAYDPEALVEAMFVRKAALRPVYEALLDVALAVGPEAKACPCGTIVPIFRKHVVAQIKPSTLTRIDFGLALGDPAKVKSKRLLDTGGFAKKDRITHRIPIASTAEIDADVKRWLEVAYDRDA
jgi:hypothetical protein